jgi:hypothetical protein
MTDSKERPTGLLNLRRREMTTEREELVEASVVIGGIGAYDCIVIPITNDGHLCPFMVGRVHASLPIPTLALETAGLRRFGKRYIFAAVCADDFVITDVAIYNALTGALVEASTEGVAVLAVPAVGVMTGFLATMEAALRSFEDLTELIGIHMPRVVFVVDGERSSTP